METIWQDIVRGIGNGDEVVRVIFRLAVAAAAGAVIGYEREAAGKAAGLRTYILVTLGACLLVLAGLSTGISIDGTARIIEGIVAGIGFLGAGTILKRSHRRDVKGLTTAAGIWVAAAIGISIGMGLVGLAVIATIATLIVLAILKQFEDKYVDRRDPSKNAQADDERT